MKDVLNWKAAACLEESSFCSIIHPSLKSFPDTDHEALQFLFRSRTSRPRIYCSWVVLFRSRTSRPRIYCSWSCSSDCLVRVVWERNESVRVWSGLETTYSSNFTWSRGKLSLFLLFWFSSMSSSLCSKTRMRGPARTSMLTCSVSSCMRKQI